MSAKKYLDEDGLLYVKQKIAGKFVEKENGKGLSSNDYTTDEKTKLAGIDDGAEENVVESVVVNGVTAIITNKTAEVTIPTGSSAIEHIEVNGTEQTITNKTVDITVPTTLGDLDNNAANIVHDESYVHTDNNYTTTEKNKLSGVEAGAEENIIETIKVNGTAQTVTSKEVDITVPTNNNQLTNGAGYQTANDVETAITSKGYQTENQVSSAISSAIAGVTQFDYKVVTILPATGVKGTIYLVANSGSGTNIYDEYLWLNDKWELFGTTEIDLSGYLQETDITPITNAEIDTIFA